MGALDSSLAHLGGWSVNSSYVRHARCTAPHRTMSHRSGAAPNHEGSELLTLPSVELSLPAQLDVPVARTNEPSRTSKKLGPEALRRRVRFAPQSSETAPDARRWQRRLAWFALGVFACLAAVTSGASRFTDSGSRNTGAAVTAPAAVAASPTIDVEAPPSEPAAVTPSEPAQDVDRSASIPAPQGTPAAAPLPAATSTGRTTHDVARPATKAVSAFDRPLAPPD